jgi:preprotein translocase subunit SecY
LDQQNLLERVLNAWRLPDLRTKLLYTIGILVIFRLIAHVPIPGVNAQALRDLLGSKQGQLLSMLDLFSGGAMSSFSVAAMGVYPYITASIVMQLLVPMIPRLEALSKEGGEAGKNRIAQYTRMLTIPLAFLQGFGQVSLLHSQSGGAIIPNFALNHTATFLPSLAMLVTLTGGTMLLVWLGELITENGIGNGLSLIIFAGIVARLPSLVSQTTQEQVAGNSLIGPIVLVIVVFLIVVGIVLIYQGERRIPVQYARRIRGGRMTQGGSTFIPLKVNSAGMIPLIFASSIILFPGNLASYFQASTTDWVRSAATFVFNLFNTQGVLYWVIYFFLVVGFAYFYTFIMFQQQNPAEQLQKHGGFITGIRPGRPTAEYLTRVLTRITLLGALFLAVVAVAPFFVRSVAQAQALTLSSTALLIVVGVVLDTMKQLEAQLLMRRYQGLLK